MIKTYLKLAWRSLLKNKVFSFINIFGLATGLTCCLLISLYLFKEFSYDAQQKLGDRLYQLETESVIDGKSARSAHTPAPMAAAMQAEFPEIESSTRLISAYQDDKTLFQYQAGKEVHSFYETDGYLADSTFFRMFSYNFVEGNPNTSLDEPNTIVISEEIAKKIFGKEPALNKIIHINSNTNGVYDFRVTGVFRPSPTPTHINGRFFMSMKGGDIASWMNHLTDMVNNNMFFSYLLLKKGADPKAVEAKFAGFIQRHAGADLKASGRNRRQYLTRVRNIHLYATEGNVTPGGSLSYLYILMSIALVTLLIACVNFMNLSTARSSKRAVEIGVRKVLGAERLALMRQFLFEAILLAIISFLIAIVLSKLLLPLFAELSGKEFSFSLQEYVFIALGFLIISLAAGLLAGLYPAFYLSAFKPVKVLKGKFSNSLAAISFRKVLVVFQFMISVALIVASIAIGNQMKYLRTQDLGFEKDQQLIIPLRTTTSKASYESLKNSLENDPAISKAGATIYYPGINNIADWLLYRQGTAADLTKDVFIDWVDDSYLQTLGIQPVAGRLFSKDFPADTLNRMVVNEEAVKNLGFASPEDAIGKNVVGSFGTNQTLFSIVGVVRNFHFKDLHAQIEPYAFLLDLRPEFNYLVAHIKPGNIKSSLTKIESSWSRLNPNEPFEYSFLDQDFQKNYEAEERLANIIRYFTIVAIFISCLGLFGLTTFSVEQRTKEIGIRKVLGASAAGIIGLLSKDFLLLVVISFALASPLAWYFTNQWLQDFAYKAPFTVWILLIAWALALAIAFITISIQAIKVAFSNPVRNLRTE